MYITIDPIYERKEGFATLMSHYAVLYNLALDTKLQPMIVRAKFSEMTAMEFFNQFNAPILYHEHVFTNFNNIFHVTDVSALKGTHWVPGDLTNYNYDQILNTIMDKDIYNHNIILKWRLDQSLYAKHLDKIINQLFVFNNDIISTSRDILPNTNKKIVAVCVRNEYKKIKCPHVKLSLNFYDNAIRIFDPASTILIIFSDDIEAAQSLLKDHSFAYETYYMNPTPSAVGLCTMSLCDHIICANSSFSYWASMLNRNPNKKIICPAKFIDPIIDPILAKSINYKWYPKDWIALDIV